MNDTLYLNNTTPEPEDINTIVFHKDTKSGLILSLEKGEEVGDWLSLDLTLEKSIDSILFEPNELLNALLQAQHLNWFKTNSSNLELMANILSSNNK